MVNLNENQEKTFGKTFVEKYLSNGFGAMTKSEMDILESPIGDP